MIDKDALSTAVRRALASSEYYEKVSLGSHGPLDGGCYMVAIALQELLGEPVELGGGFLPGYTNADHATAMLDGLYLDANGLQTKAEIERYWLQEEHRQLSSKPCEGESLMVRIHWDADECDRCIKYLYPLLEEFRGFP